MNFIKTLLVALVIGLMAGCATTQSQPEPPQFRNVFVRPSAALMRDCPISAPPAKEAFLKLTSDEQKTLLAKYSVSLLGDLKACNTERASLREWMDTQEKIHTKDNSK